jgi:hypothetical protein
MYMCACFSSAEICGARTPELSKETNQSIIPIYVFIIALTF